MVEVHVELLDRELAAFVDFASGTQVDNGAHTAAAHFLEIGAGEAVQPVGAVDHAPPGDTAIGGGVPTEIAEIVDCVERDEAPRIGTQCFDIDGG